MKTTMLIFGIIAITVLFTVAVCVILSIPFATIWALNTLFGFTIAYTFWNWVACWVLLLTLHGVPVVKVTKR
jgi:hypothetical protein